MKYVLDTNFFVISKNYYPESFPSFWQKMEVAVSKEKISSVKEVRKELERYGGEQEYLLAWIKNHKNIFTEPSENEQDLIRQILRVPDFQELIERKSLLRGYPSADPFLIAKASVTGGVVVTAEKFASKGKPPKIPNVCKRFRVECVTPEEFMSRERWQF